MPAISTIYNPQEMREDLFLKSFVVRRALLDELLRDIRDTAPGERFQHTILQGQRGQGKTTLLRKVSLCVRDDPALSPWLIPILFREEEYSVVALCRLWERTADYLAEHPGFEHLPDEFQAGLESPHYEADCFEILARVLEREDKHLLLLIDNFGEMLDKFGKADQQRFREILMTSRRIRIVAGSAATLEQHYDHGKPFFNFFRLRTLGGLNAQEARELMLNLGTDEQKRRMAEILETRPGKLEALRRLTAGVPRTLILLLEIFLDDDGSAMEDLETLLDGVTPLYKHRLDDLPPQQQAIVYEIAMGWDALSVKEIAAKARLPSKQVSAQLQALEKNQVIRSIATSTKNKLYQLEERFFNIWCLMRLGRAGDKRRAVWLVRFLEIWCDQKELADRVRQHISSLNEGKIESRHAFFLTQAFADALKDMDLQDELLNTAKNTLNTNLLPDSDKFQYLKATTLFQEGKIEEAIDCLSALAKKGYEEFSGALSNLKAFPRMVDELEMLIISKTEESKNNEYNVFLFAFGVLVKAIKKFPRENHLPFCNILANRWQDVRLKFLVSSLFLCCDEYSLAYKETLSALKAMDPTIQGYTAFMVGNLLMFSAKNQISVLLRFFEDGEYAALKLKERAKLLYYVSLREAGPARADDALRMGPELEETVEEIRREIERMRQDYRIDPAEVAGDLPADGEITTNNVPQAPVE